MSMVNRWWSERSAAQRFDLYTRGSLYGLAAGEVVLAAMLVLSLSEQDVRPAGVAVLLALAVVHTVVAIWILRAGMKWYLGQGPWPRWAVVVLAVVTALGAVTAVWAFHGSTVDVPPEGSGASAAGVLLFAGFFVLALTPRLTSSWLLFATVVVTGCVAGAIHLLGWPGARTFAFGISTGLALLGGVLAFRGSVWMLGVMWELEGSRRTQAQLAVAEERLRFARDLHDVLGRNLSVMALKSELAAQLSRRGRAEAEAEMMAVRDIAQESLREVREVVHGYRAADLTSELAGARSVLRSAGVDTRVVGDGAQLPGEVQSVLGWVVREATTNVLRHSQARSCVITVARDGGQVRLTMRNDGVGAGPPEQGDAGSGLSGLEERLRAMGGTLAVERPQPGSFQLVASVPVQTVREGAR